MPLQLMKSLDITWRMCWDLKNLWYAGISLHLWWRWDYSYIQWIWRNNLILKLKLPAHCHRNFPMETPTSMHLTGKDEEINLIIKTTDGKLKQYYADYKLLLSPERYGYPKSLGSGIDRKHRKAATKYHTPGLPARCLRSPSVPYSRSNIWHIRFPVWLNSRACLKIIVIIHNIVKAISNGLWREKPSHLLTEKI